MASNKKKRLVGENSCSSSDLNTKHGDCLSDGTNRILSTNTDDNEEQMDTGEVQVDFEARNPEDCDFHGMKKLLKQLFLKADVNLSELTDTLIRQNYVGSIIKQVPVSEEEEDEDEDDDDIFGLVSALSISTDNPQKSTAANDIRKYLIEKCSSCGKTEKEEMAAVFNNGDHRVGFLINERFMNIPPQIALPAFESLWKEIERAKKKGMPYNFTHYVLLCKMLRMAPLAVPGGKKQKPVERSAWDTVYVNAEEEYFAEEALLQCDFSVRDERDLDSESDDMEPWRRVLVIAAHKIDPIMEQLRRDLSQT